ncbi:hypothetical protein RHGRI_011279 [Rhododendron griersonianum]|uniref:Uncharacterized protein n=1 Tax=Rhododendron griersonianum TaxID=479676 RepID=A0AAV6KLP6_9ERIC|nr:hypothetical protein RHGRI_011279 [Rhododendron griersonianum]
MWNNRLDHIVPAGEADPHEYAYPVDDPYVSWYERITIQHISRLGGAADKAMRLFERLRTVQTMEDIDLDELRSIGEEGVGAMAYLEKWLRKRPPMEPNQPQAEGVNVAEEVDPLHEPVIEVENAQRRSRWTHSYTMMPYRIQWTPGLLLRRKMQMGVLPVLKRKETLDGDDGGSSDAPQLGDDLVGTGGHPTVEGDVKVHVGLDVQGEQGEGDGFVMQTHVVEQEVQEEQDGDFPGQCSQYRYNYDTTSLQGQSSAEFPFHDTTFRGSASQLHDELIEEEREGSTEETDEGSKSSLEDVDAALEADGFEDNYIDGQGNAIPAHKPPCPMYTQDTWLNIIDPGPPMPTRSHLGWDGISEFFEGQVIFSQLILFQS